MFVYVCFIMNFKMEFYEIKEICFCIGGSGSYCGIFLCR